MRPHLTNLAMFAALLVTSLLLPPNARAGEINLEAFNFHDRHIRHRNLLMYVEPFSDALSIDDSAFKVIEPGLAGTCHSFESRNLPGFFIRHQNTRLKLAKFENQELFKNDATFCLRPGLSDQVNGTSLESLNYPGKFVRHQDFELHIQPFENDELFKKDATFYQRKAAVSFGNDNVGIPATD